MASPSKSVFLHLVPLNEEALEILRLPANERVLGYTPDKHELALALDIDGRHRDPLVVATIGRDRTHNVVLPPFQHYARNQCSFFHNRPFGELLIEDHSGARSTSIDYLEEGLEKFRLGGPLRRRVVRYPAITRLILHNACFSLEVVLNQFVSDLKNYILNIPIPPDLEPSILPLSLPPTNKHTRTAAPKEHVPNQGICHFRIREIGRGLSGIVSETVNVVTGDHMAVKTICVREKDLDEKVIKDAAKSQIDNLEKLDHPNIVSIIRSEGWGLGQDLQIFMNLYHGDLRSCIANSEINHYGPTLVKTMLEVLAFLTQKGVTHGDIKPANILFDRQGRFYLTDFGLIGNFDSPRGYTISEHYAAPEAYHQQLSPKSDIWSLGVVVLDILKKRPEFPPPLIWTDQRKEYHESIVGVAREISFLPRMLSTQPTQRDDAETCLNQFFANDHCGWPFTETSSPDIDMTTVPEKKRARRNPYRVAKNTQKSKKHKGLIR